MQENEKVEWISEFDANRHCDYSKIFTSSSCIVRDTKFRIIRMVADYGYGRGGTFVPSVGAQIYGPYCAALVLRECTPRNMMFAHRALFITRHHVHSFSSKNDADPLYGP